jgi:hypothetical protein
VRWVSDDDVRQQNRFIDRLFDLAETSPPSSYRGFLPPAFSKLQHFRQETLVRLA